MDARRNITLPGISWLGVGLLWSMPCGTAMQFGMPAGVMMIVNQQAACCMLTFGRWWRFYVRLCGSSSIIFSALQLGFAQGGCHLR
jgi:hypothetical protein